tara:strand:- start:898 stop:1995 length:1098 start_codon:yes stop_codon:yes gene_type:complete
MIPYQDELGNELNIRRNSLDDAINSYTANTIRENLKNGKQDPHCVRCWTQENVGRRSKRIIDNEHRANLNRDISVQILDLNMGTTCNIKCRTCSPDNSSVWNKEFIALHDSIEGHTGKKEMTEYFRQFNKSFEDDSAIWKDMESHLSRLKYIDMYGGEPMLMKKQWKLLKTAIDRGYAPYISLHYNTNGTLWDEEKFNILNEFKHISMDFSLDGIYDRFEFMRHPAKWQPVIENFRTLKDISKTNKKFDVSIAHTVSTLNIWYIPEFLEYFKGENMYLNLVHGPTHFNIVNIPEEVKDVIEKHLGHEDPKVVEIINFMNGKKSNPLEWIKFFPNVKGSDEYRKEDFREFFPEFYKVLTNHGYEYE